MKFDETTGKVEEFGGFQWVERCMGSAEVVVMPPAAKMWVSLADACGASARERANVT